MGKKEKLIKRLKSKPNDFTFDEAVALMHSLGMKRIKPGKTSGPRVNYELNGVKVRMHKPHPHNVLLRYQLNDLLDTLTEGGLI